jgi:hypothetical protein
MEVDDTSTQASRHGTPTQSPDWVYILLSLTTWIPWNKWNNQSWICAQTHHVTQTSNFFIKNNSFHPSLFNFNPWYATYTCRVCHSNIHLFIYTCFNLFCTRTRISHQHICIFYSDISFHSSTYPLVSKDLLQTNICTLCHKNAFFSLIHPFFHYNMHFVTHMRNVDSITFLTLTSNNLSKRQGVISSRKHIVSIFHHNTSFFS